MEFRRATLEDMSALSTLINAENESSITAEHLKKWFWDNPFNSSSIILCESDGKVEGVGINITAGIIDRG